MRLLEEKISKEGKVLPGNILKVGSFLNQQLDVAFLNEVGKEIASLYKNDNVTKILTIEASGIAIAVMAGLHLGVPVVVAKKHPSANQSKDVYAAEIASFTHGNVYTATVAKEYIKKDDRILVVDDFLACGNAIRGLRKMIEDAGAVLVGSAIAVEKGFQHGGDELRAAGFRVDSLAIVEEMNENGIRYR